MMMMMMKLERTMSVNVSTYDDLYSASPSNALCAVVQCDQKCLQQAPERICVGVRIADRVRKTVPGGRTSSGKSPAAAVRTESVPPCYVQ